MKFKILLALIPLGIAACGGAVEPQATLRIAISPAAHPVSEAVLGCAPASEELFVSIDSYYPGTFELADYDVIFELGEPAEKAGFVAQIASEEIVLVINPTLGLSQLDRDLAADIFSGRSVTWEEFANTAEPVTVWVGPQGDEARKLFIQEILLGSPIFGSANLATSPEQMLAEIAADPNAIGVLPSAWADETVQQIGLDVVVPVLAVSAAEPSGPAREMLACLQSETGQNVIGEKYEPFAGSDNGS